MQMCNKYHIGFPNPQFCNLNHTHTCTAIMYIAYITYIYVYLTVIYTEGKKNHSDKVAVIQFNAICCMIKDKC